MALMVKIKKRLGSFFLDVDFEAGEETFALLGASGCGKSLTLKCIAGIETPDEGEIILNGNVLFCAKDKINLPPQKRKVGYLFQDYALFPSMTVAQNIKAALGRKRQGKLREYLADYHLEGLEKQYPGQLSGGQKQRAAMARMMAAEPELILLDEPFSALDSYLKGRMLREMREEIRKRELPAVFVSHDRDEVYAMSKIVCAMNCGKTEKQEEKRRFFANPGSVTAAELSGCKNISPVRLLDAHHAFAADWGVVLERKETEIPVDTAAVGIRAHDLIPLLKQEETCGRKDKECRSVNQFPVTSARIEEELFEWNIYVRLGEGQNELLWKIPRKQKDPVEKPQLPSILSIPEERILWLKA